MDESLVEDVISCATCRKSGRRDQTRLWHPFRHPIIGVGESSPAPDSLVEEDVHSAAPFPFDPVLRQALVDKGVLTVEDLMEADKKIRMVSGMVSDDVSPPVSRGSRESTNVFQPRLG